MVESLRIGRVFRLFKIIRTFTGGKKLFFFFEKSNLPKSLYSLCILTFLFILFISFSVFMVENQLNSQIDYFDSLRITFESIITTSLFKESLSKTANNYLMLAIVLGLLFISALTAIIISFFNNKE